jgi:DNA-binding transcriptional ArsR family regulator
MRILMAVAGRQVTAQQLAAELSDVPQATLYRHINALAKAGVLKVVEERPVRGTSEKVYTLQGTAALLTAEDMASLTREEHMQMFTTFVVSLMGDFARYLEREHVDFMADGVSFTSAPLNLSDEEFLELGRKMSEVILPVLNNEPTPGRKRRMFSTIVMPAPDEKDQKS